jgi:hypothetical protein
MFEFENCMFFTFFHEFLHKDILEGIASEQNIKILYPTLSSISSDIHNDKVDEIQDILQNNLKLFFNPSSPPCGKLIPVLETNGFKLIHALHDRWIFHKLT